MRSSLLSIRIIMSEQQKITASLLYLMTRFVNNPSCQVARTIMHQFRLLNALDEEDSGRIADVARRLARSWQSIIDRMHDEKLQSRVNGIVLREQGSVH
jgi:hypothetical protein